MLGMALLECNATAIPRCRRGDVAVMLLFSTPCIMHKYGKTN